MGTIRFTCPAWDRPSRRAGPGYRRGLPGVRGEHRERVGLRREHQRDGRRHQRDLGPAAHRRAHRQPAAARPTGVWRGLAATLSSPTLALTSEDDPLSRWRRACRCSSEVGRHEAVEGVAVATDEAVDETGGRARGADV